MQLQTWPLFLFLCNIRCELLTDANNCLNQKEVRLKPVWSKLYQRKYDLVGIGADLLKSLRVFQHGGSLRNNRFITNSLFNCIGVVAQVPLTKYIPSSMYQYLDTVCMKSGDHAVAYYQDRFMSLTKIKSALSEVYSEGNV